MKRTNKMYRLLALMLSVLMLIACMPFAVSAADTEFVSENLFQTHLESTHEAVCYIWNNNSEIWNSETGTFNDAKTFDNNGALAGSVDNDLTQAYNVYAWAEDKTGYVGARYHLDDVYYCGELTIYSGMEDNKDIFRVYASDNLETLYSSPVNVVSTSVVCDGTATTVAINRSIKYISIFFDNQATAGEVEGSEEIGDYTARVVEFQLWTAKEPVVSENLFQTHLDSKYEAVYQSWCSSEIADEENGGFVVDARFDNNGALTGSVDNDIAKTYDVYAYSDTSTNFIGARYHLDDVYYCGELVIYSGIAGNNDIYRVYASDKLEDLYTNPKNVVTTSAVCDGTGTTVAINRNIKYISIFFDNVATTDTSAGERAGDGMARVAEFQLFSAEDPNSFVSENLFQTDLAKSETIAMYHLTGNLYESATDKFDQNGALAGSVDGDIVTTTPVYDCITDWEYPIYPGALYTLNGNNYADNLTIYANGKIKIYAGDALDTLYAGYNCVAEELEVTKDGTEINLDKYVKYVAIFCIGYVDVAEFQLWSGDPAGAVAPDDSTLRVLTLGNSFSENTSRYVTDIAYANGLELTFGYLKYPSCSIPQYLEAANNDWSLFKFDVVAPDGTHQVIKNEAGSFNKDASNPTTCASIAEALEFTDWDVVVFQMDSFNSLDGANFNALPALIEYVEGIEPDAKLMLHEVWAWGTWQNDPDKNFAKMKANNEAAAIASDIAIIPSGLAFENARKELGSYTILNQDDGYWQHANNYGCYLAGATYVASLIGAVDVDTFDGHSQVDDNGYVQTLNAAANAAVKYYNSYGDANNSGEVENTDLASLRKYLIGAGTVETTLADANYNGEIDITDLIRVKKHLAGVEVVLGPSK